MQEWFDFEDGTISISLKTLTAFGCMLITTYLATILYLICNNVEGECSWTGVVPEWPSISSILCRPFYDRLCCMTFTFFSLVVLQTDVRAYYKKLYGKVSNSTNDGIFLLGMITTISLPCISYFDMHNYGFFHYVFAILFFGCCFFYIWFTVGSLVEHKAEFAQDEWDSIDRADKFRKIMLASALFYGYVKLFMPSTHSDFYEWVITFMYLNALAIMNLGNKFYDTVHEELPVPATKTVFA